MSTHKVVLITPSAGMTTSGGAAVTAEAGTDDAKANAAWAAMLVASPIADHNAVVDVMALMPAMIARIRQSGRYVKQIDLITDMLSLQTEAGQAAGKISAISEG